MMRLDRYDASGFDRGRPRWVEALWWLVQFLAFSTPVPGSRWRRALLRAFGAELGRGVVIKPSVRVKFPWRLQVGEHCWLGESVWIDNLAPVRMGAHCCVSQGAYLCAGNHDWRKEGFDLRVAPIEIGNSVWIGAQCKVAPGARIGDNVVLTLGSVAVGELTPGRIYTGVPAEDRGPRQGSSAPHD
jgi:putative colanic acid biosynthesis acetyltransferase WcaF